MSEYEERFPTTARMMAHEAAGCDVAAPFPCMSAEAAIKLVGDCDYFYHCFMILGGGSGRKGMIGCAYEGLRSTKLPRKSQPRSRKNSSNGCRLNGKTLRRFGNSTPNGRSSGNG